MAAVRSQSLAKALAEAGPAIAGSSGLRELVRAFPSPSDSDLAEVFLLLARSGPADSGASEETERGRAWSEDEGQELGAALAAQRPVPDAQRTAAALERAAAPSPPRECRAAGTRAALALWAAVFRGARFPARRAVLSGLWRDPATQASLAAALLRAASMAPAPAAALDPPAANVAWLNAAAAFDRAGAPAALRLAALALDALGDGRAGAAAGPMLGAAGSSWLGRGAARALRAARALGGWSPAGGEQLVAAPLRALLRSDPAGEHALLARALAKDPTALAGACAAMGAGARELLASLPREALDAALAEAPLPAALDLAEAASATRGLDAPAWLAGRLRAEGDPAGALRGAVAWVGGRLVAADPLLRRQPAPPPPAPLVTAVLVAASRAAVAASPLAAETKTAAAVAERLLPAAAPELQAARNLAPFPGEVEKEANSTFQGVYAGALDAAALAAALSAGAASGTDPRARTLLACVLHNLMEEARFFARYPDRELAVTADVFGELILGGAISPLELGLAFRTVLDALAPRAAAPKLARFAVRATRRFASRLPEYPGFSLALAEALEATGAPDDLAREARAAALGGRAPLARSPIAGVAGMPQPSLPSSLPPSQALGAAQQPPVGVPVGVGAATPPRPGNPAARAPPTTPPPSVPAPGLTARPLASAPTTAPAAAAVAAAPSTTPGPTLFAASTSSVLDRVSRWAEFEQPDGATRDRVAFLVNNVDASSAAQRAPGIAAVITPRLLPWFVDYLVIKRASQEPVFHAAYVTVAENWGDDGECLRLLTKVACHYCRGALDATMGIDRAASSKGSAAAAPSSSSAAAATATATAAAASSSDHDGEAPAADGAGAQPHPPQPSVRPPPFYVPPKHEPEAPRVSAADRAVLRNLGAFLGALTLARDRPVLARDLDLRDVLLDAVATGRLHPALMFVRMLFDKAPGSRAFPRTSPWVSFVLSMLAETYELPKLRISCRFEVEITFKAFGVSPGEVAPSRLLRRVPWPTESADFDAAAAAGAAVAAATSPNVPAPVAAGATAAAAAAAAVAAARAAATPAAATAATAAASSTGVGSAPGGGVAPPGTAASAATTPASPAALGIAGAGASAVRAGRADAVAATPRAGLASVPAALAGVADRLGLRPLLAAAVDRALAEVAAPVVDRAATISAATASELALKDCGLSRDPAALGIAARQAVCGLARAMAAATAREPLRTALAQALRTPLSRELDHTTAEQVLALLLNENVDSCVRVVEGAAEERATTAVEARLADELEARTRPGWEPAAPAPGSFVDSLPEALRPPRDALSRSQAAVYEAFLAHPPVAGGAPVTLAPAGAAAPPMPAAAGAPTPVGARPDLRIRLSAWFARLEAALAVANDPSASMSAAASRMEVLAIASEASSLPAGDSEAADVARVLFGRLLAAASSSPGAARAECQALAMALAALRERTGMQRLAAELSAALATAPEAQRWPRDAVEALLGARLLAASELDMPLARALAEPRAAAAGEAALLLLQAAATPDGAVSAAEMPRTLEALTVLASRAAGGQAVLSLVEDARRLAQARSHPGARLGAAGAAAATDAWASRTHEPPELVEAAAWMLEAWSRPGLADAPARAAALARLRARNVPADASATAAVLLAAARLALHHASRIEAATAQSGAPGAHLAVDAWARAAAALAREASHASAADGSEQALEGARDADAQGAAARRELGTATVRAAFGALTQVILEDPAASRGELGARSCLRAGVGLLAELTPAGTRDARSGFGGGELDSLDPLPHAVALLGSCAPRDAPWFAAAWLSLLADPRVLSRLAPSPVPELRMSLLRLLLLLLNFMRPNLAVASMPPTIGRLYRGTLRVLLVLLHDSPVFLAEHAHALCSALPVTCVQARNLVLSASPKDVLLPDPFSTSGAPKTMPGAEDPPVGALPASDILGQEAAAAAEAAIAAARDRRTAVLEGGSAADARARTVLAKAVRTALAALASDAHAMGISDAGEPTPAGAPTDSQLASFALYMVTRAADEPAAAPAVMRATTRALRALAPRTCYALLNGLANQLRYPNSHTRIASGIVLAAFKESPKGTDSRLQEQVTRVLLERVVVNRPHPWGLLVTFFELLKNPEYSFWSHQFTQAAPEIKQLFDSVSRSCVAQQGQQARPASDAGAQVASA